MDAAGRRKWQVRKQRVWGASDSVKRSYIIGCLLQLALFCFCDGGSAKCLRVSGRVVFLRRFKAIYQFGKWQKLVFLGWRSLCNVSLWVPEPERQGWGGHCDKEISVVIIEWMIRYFWGLGGVIFHHNDLGVIISEAKNSPTRRPSRWLCGWPFCSTTASVPWIKNKSTNPCFQSTVWKWKVLVTLGAFIANSTSLF